MSLRLLAFSFLAFGAQLSAQEIISAPSATVSSDAGPATDQAIRKPPSYAVKLAPAARFSLPVLADTERTRPTPRAGLTLVGVQRALGAQILNAGRCEDLPNGGKIWRLALESPEATGIRIHFEQFNAGAGSVWLHNEGDPPQVEGPYTGRGTFGDGDFWSAVIFGDRAVVEYQPGPGQTCENGVPFRISQVSHLWERIAATPRSSTGATSIQPVQVGPLPKSKPGGLTPRLAEPAAACNLDATCYPEYSHQAKSVARYIFSDGTGSYLCSGALINTKPYTGTPYFLTANHCVQNDAEARTVDVFWFYETPYCNGPAPDMNTLPYQTAGGTFLAGGPIAEGDFTLLQLSSVAGIPNLWYAGWTTAAPAENESVVGIHHPGSSNDYKRIAFGVRVADSSISFDDGQTGAATLYYAVRWDEGRTQPGSSGSPLFVYSSSLAEWVIGGTLTAGPKTTDYCNYTPYIANYGRFSVSYPYLKDYLNLQTCSFLLSPSDYTSAYTGGSGSISVTVSSGCSWTATSDVSWLRITSGTSGSGNGTVYYSVDPNSSSYSRSGTISVGDQAFTVTQYGRPLCSANSISLRQTVSGTIGYDTCTSLQMGAGHSAALYSFTASAGQRIAISVNSSSFDTYVYLFDPGGQIVSENDDGGGGTNSRIPPVPGDITLPVSGTYNIEVTSYTSYASGSFQLTVSDPSVNGARGDFNLDGKTDMIWLNDATRQATVNYYGGAHGNTLLGWNWLNTGGVPGWKIAAAADFDRNGVPDLVWQNDTTRQVTVHYYGGTGGATLQGWNWLQPGNMAGWHVVGAADFNGDGVPDLIWQNDTTRQVTVHYYGGTGGATLVGWNWLQPGNMAGWHVAGAADFNGDGVPDLIWQNDTTRQVTVNYYGGTGGATLAGWNWLQLGTMNGWQVAGAADFDGNGTADLVWLNDTTRQVTVHYYGGAQGNVLQGWNWLNSSGVPGWCAIIPR